ncbi:hypothetical protein EJ07DRAFT_151450 [Lizonia empirigonia]|nr:hypothetical protein EJ07DRAFT_151450 [Lizonia empirigonia]
MAYYRPDQRAQGQYLGQPSYPVQQQYFHVGQQYVFSGQQQSIAPGQQQYFAPGQQQPNDPGQQQYFASEQQQYYTPEQQQYFNSADNEQNASEQQAQDPPVQEAPLQTTFEPQHHSEIAFEEASLPPEAGSHNQLLLSYEPHDEDSMFSTSSSAVDTSVPSMFYGLPQAGQSLDVNAGNFGEGGSGPEVDMQDARAEAWAQSFQQNNSGHSAADTQFFYPEASGWVTPAPQSYLEQELLHTNPLPESHIPETNPEVSVTAFDRDVDNEHPSNASSPMHRDPDQTYNPGYPHQAETYPEQPLGYRNNIAPHDVEQAFAP